MISFVETIFKIGVYLNMNILKRFKFFKIILSSDVKTNLQALKTRDNNGTVFH